MALRRPATSRRSSRVLKKSANKAGQVTDKTCGNDNCQHENEEKESKGRHQEGTIAQFNPSIPEAYYMARAGGSCDFFSADFTVWPNNQEERMKIVLPVGTPSTADSCPDNGTTLLDSRLAGSDFTISSGKQPLGRLLNGGDDASNATKAEVELNKELGDDGDKREHKPRRRSMGGLNLAWDIYRNSKVMVLTQDEKQQQHVPKSGEKASTTLTVASKSSDDLGNPKQHLKRRPSLKDLMFPKASESHNSTNETSLIKKNQATSFAKKILQETTGKPVQAIRRSHSFRGLFGGTIRSQVVMDDSSLASFAEDEAEKDYEDKIPTTLCKESSRESKSNRCPIHSSEELMLKQSDLTGSRSKDRRASGSDTTTLCEGGQCHITASKSHQRNSHSSRRIHKSSSHRHNDHNTRRDHSSRRHSESSRRNSCGHDRKTLSNDSMRRSDHTNKATIKTHTATKCSSRRERSDLRSTSHNEKRPHETLSGNSDIHTTADMHRWHSLRDVTTATKLL